MVFRVVPLCFHVLSKFQLVTNQGHWATMVEAGFEGKSHDQDSCWVIDSY